MTITMSNIAWPPARSDEVAEYLSTEGVHHIEIAPTIRWEDPSSVDIEDARAYRAWWNSREIAISSMQALLYGRPDLTIFDNAEIRRSTSEYLGSICRLAGWLGAGPLVFGSPKNRLRGKLPQDEAFEVAIEFFAGLAPVAAEHGTAICIEANPVAYGADFILDAGEAASIVRAIDHPGIALHLDTACMYLAGDHPADVVAKYADILHHVHVSEPDLAPVGGVSDVPHVEMATALATIEYENFVSIEMRSTTDPFPAIKRAVSFAQAVYSGGED